MGYDPGSRRMRGMSLTHCESISKFILGNGVRVSNILLLFLSPVSDFVKKKSRILKRFIA